VVQFEPPPDGLASKVPLKISLLLPAKAVITAEKMHEHPRRDRTKIMQCFLKCKERVVFILPMKTKRAAPPSAARNKGIGTKD